MKIFNINKTINLALEFKEPIKDLSDLYIYKDSNKKTIEVYINDEIKIPLNLEKIFIKKYSKIYKFQTKRFFDSLVDVTFKLNKDSSTKDEINFDIVYEFEDNFIK
jgi:hypothetical protein